jgi:hypothetical protein
MASCVSAEIRAQNSEQFSGRPNFSPKFQVHVSLVEWLPVVHFELIQILDPVCREVVVQSVQDD